MDNINGFIILNKRKGCTSHDCVKQIRKLFNIKKVGHTGTLDPEVTGVLPIALGNATRFIQYLPQEKIYLGVIQLGISTKTDDIYGDIICKKEWPILSNKELEKILDSFRGTFKQVPPKVSSVHINGERAYKRSFRNETFDLPEREVTVSELTLKKWDHNNGQILLQIKCSSGTYIRAIARDLGLSLHSVGCLYSLQRTKASGFDIKDALDLNEMQITSGGINKFIIPINSSLKHLDAYILSTDQEVLHWSTGRKIQFSFNDSFSSDIFKSYNPLKVINYKNELLGIGIPVIDETYYLKPKLVLNAK